MKFHLATLKCSKFVGEVNEMRNSWEKYASVKMLSDNSEAFIVKVRLDVDVNVV